MLLLKQLLRFFKTQLLLLSDIFQEFLIIILLIIFDDFCQNRLLNLHISINSQKRWNLIFIYIHKILHFECRKLKHAFFSDILQWNLYWWQLCSRPSRTRVRGFDLKISSVSQLPLGFLFLHCFNLFRKRVLPTQDISVRFSEQSGLRIKKRDQIIFRNFL